MANPRCFLDFSIGGGPTQRVVFELFKDEVPKTVENFRALCTGEKGPSSQGPPLHYKNCLVHRSIENFMIQSGDFIKSNGSGGESIYGKTFEDESFEREVDSAGLLMMANRGPDTNSSQFFVTAVACPHLNGKHVCFGKVVSGLESILTMSKTPTDKKDRPLSEIRIVHCGELERRVATKRSISPVSSAASSEISETKSEKKRRRKEEKYQKKKSERKKLKFKETAAKDKSLIEDALSQSLRLAAEAQQREAEALELEMIKERAEERQIRLEKVSKRVADEEAKGGVRFKGRGKMIYRDQDFGGMRGWN